MDSSRKIRIARLLILGFCFLFFCGTFFILQQREDPLTRYPYGDEQQREQLRQTLDSDEINVLINSQIQPEQVLPFAGREGFEIANTLWYSKALQASPADPGFIIDFVNRYRDRTDPGTLGEILSWLNYADLISYYESGSTLPLSSNPETSLQVYNGSTTLWKWRPQDLVTIGDGLLLKREAADAWNAMRVQAAAEGVRLEAVSGLIPYDQQPYAPVYGAYPLGPYGTWEEQLGTVVHVRGFDAWNAMMNDQNLESPDVQGVKNALSEDDRKELDWLAANAWKYGWIVRYPENGREQTGRIWQPFVLRYVGQADAAAMHDAGLTLEQYVSEQAGG